MVRIDLLGIHRVRSRKTGVEYHYAFRGGPCIWRTGHPYAIGSPEYVAAFQAATRPERATGTFQAVIDAYLTSRDFRSLAGRTRRDYRAWIARIEAKFGSAPIEAFNRREIRAVALKWRDGWTGRQAEYAWTVLRRIVSWAHDRGMLREHHITGGGRVYAADRADLIWMPDEIARIEAAAPEPIRRAVTLMLWTGLAPVDLIRVTRFHIKTTPAGRRIEIRRAKTGILAGVPLFPEAARIVDATPEAQSLILLSPRGKPWSAQWLSKEVKRIGRSAGIREELHLNDLRGNAATRLMSAGCSLAEIALVMGWSPRTAAKMIETYAAADPAISDAVLARIGNESEAEV